MTEGKKISTLIIVLLAMQISPTCSSPATLRGGLLYAEATPHRAIYINQNKFTTTRKANTAFMQSGTQLNRDITRLYSDHCEKIKKGLGDAIKPLEDEEPQLGQDGHGRATTQPPLTATKTKDETKRYLVSPLSHHIMHAPSVCLDMDARLPEIRTSNQKEQLRQTAIHFNVSLIYAGIEFENKGPLFQYISDKVNARSGSPFGTEMEYGGDFLDATHKGTWERSNWITKQAIAYPVIYKNPQGNFIIRIADAREKWAWTKIICEQDIIKSVNHWTKSKNGYEPDMLTMLAYHNCIRDRHALMTMTETLESDIATITKLDMMLIAPDSAQSSYLPHFARPNRQTWPKTEDTNEDEEEEEEEANTENPTIRKRRSPIGPAAVAVGVVAVDSVASALSGKSAPLSFIGKGMGWLFGLKTEDDSEEFYELALKTATEVKTLQINDKEIIQAVHDLQKQINKYGKDKANSYMSMMSLNIELDLKAMARHIQNLLVATLHKWANIFVAASAGTISPYALTPSELIEITDEIKRSKDLQLSQDLNDIDMKCLVINNTLHLIFEIPILENDHLFNFYKVDTMPIFAGSKTMIPEIDAQHIAISKSGSSYITLSADEYTQCTTDTKHCEASSLISPISNTAHCVIKTYTTQALSCPLVGTNRITTPTVHLNGNKTIYSVPEETTLYIKCRDSRNPTKFKDETVKISGMGEITFKSGCAIVLPGGQTFRTPSTYTGYQMENSKIYDLLRSHPIQTNITIKKMIEEEIPLTHLTIGEFQMPSWSEFAAETLHPIRSMPFITKFFICGLLVVIIMIIIKYLYKKNLLCCIRNNNMVNIPYMLPPENTNASILAQIRQEMNNIRTQISTRINRSNRSTARSSPNMNNTRDNLQTSERSVHFNRPILRHTNQGQVDDFASSREQVSML